MAEAPEITAALRAAEAARAGQMPNLDDMYMATYGTSAPNLAQTVGYEPMRPRTDLNFPAVQSNGSVYMPGGVRDAYLNQGIPPVLNNQGGFTNVAWRTFVNPWGQMLVQPMIGAATTYPHVVSGVPTDFQNTMGYINSLLGPLPMYQPMMQPPSQSRAGRGAAAGAGAGAGAGNTTSSAKTTQQSTVKPPAQWVHYGDKRANADYMPVSPENQAWLNSLEQPDRPWYAPIVDDMAEMGITLPWLSYKPASTPQTAPAAQPQPQVAPAAQPQPQPQPPLSYDDGPFVNGYNPYAATPAPAAQPLPLSQRLQAPSPMQMMFPDGLPQVQIPQSRAQLQVPPLVQAPQENAEPFIAPPAIAAPQSVAPIPSVLRRIPVR